jgi:DNA-binding beta-propeller fold protein YncE
MLSVTIQRDSRTPVEDKLMKSLHINRRSARFVGTILIAAASLAPHLASAPQAPSSSAQPAPPTQDYLVFVVCESADKVALIRFGPHGIRVERETHIGLMPMDINGPHGIAVSPDKKFVYVAVGHGRPDGTAWKLNAATGETIRYTSLGLFPATTDISSDGTFLFVANANFHGDMVPSSISVVATQEMAELKRITTCVMPHGSRLNPDNTRHYSACMMDDMLAEIDTNAFEVSRHFLLTKGKEAGMNGPPAAMPAMNKDGASTAAEKKDASTSAPSAHDVPALPSARNTTTAAPHSQDADRSHESMDMSRLTCVPTWAQPNNDGSEVYVACNKGNEIIAIDVATWKIARRFPAANGVYNLAMTKDGRLIATNKRGQSVSIFDPKSGRELARLATKRKVVHGAVVSPDNRYAFISVEGIGSDPGTVEIIDLDALKTIATIDVGQQAAGIDFYKTEPLP